MPSTLYESVKKSVIEFAELRRKNEKKEDRMIFRWKLVTLGLSIVFIILVGVFSQILKATNSLPDLAYDRSFLLPLLQQASSTAIPSVLEANDLVTGITATLDATESDYEWNRATLLFNHSPTSPPLSLTALLAAITAKQHLAFVLASAEAAPLSKFAFFAYAEYSENQG